MSDEQPIPLRRTSVVAAATIGSGWVVTIAVLAGTLTARTRTIRWEDAMTGIGSVDAAVAADEVYRTVSSLVWAPVIAWSISIACWSRLMALNARQRRESSVSQWWASLGWFIPITGIYYGGRELRRAVSSVGGSTRRITWWMVALYLEAVAGLVVLLVQQTDITTRTPINQIQREVWMRMLLTMISVISAVISTRTILVVDRTVSRTRRNKPGKILSMRPAAQA